MDVSPKSWYIVWANIREGVIMMKRLVTVIVLLGFAFMVSGSAMAVEEKGTCDNPVKETIDGTATIKAQQPKPFASKGKAFDVLGRSIPTETDNSGKI
jgi:hypothetical protein